MNTHSIATPRVLLDVPVVDDVAALFDLVGGNDRRKICENLLWDGPDEPAEVAEWVEKCATLPYGEWGWHWVLRDRTGNLSGTRGAPLGAVGMSPVADPRRVDIGYWLGVPFWRRGIMSEALTALLDFAFDQGAVKIEAEVFTHNTPGNRLVESVGFDREGTIRRSRRKYGEWVDTNVYGMIFPTSTASANPAPGVAT